MDCLYPRTHSQDNPKNNGGMRTVYNSLLFEVTELSVQVIQERLLDWKNWVSWLQV